MKAASLLSDVVFVGAIVRLKTNTMEELQAQDANNQFAISRLQGRADAFDMIRDEIEAVILAGDYENSR